MRLNRKYEQGEEFKARQGNLFAEIVTFVLDVAVAVRRDLVKFARGFLKSIRMPQPAMQQPLQLPLPFMTRSTTHVAV